MIRSFVSNQEGDFQIITGLIRSRFNNAVSMIISRAEFSYILLIIDYFSRFVWTWAYRTNSSEVVIQCLTELFSKQRIPVGMYSTYMDPGLHFEERVGPWATTTQGVMWVNNSLVAAKKAVDVY